MFASCSDTIPVWRWTHTHTHTHTHRVKFNDVIKHSEISLKEYKHVHVHTNTMCILLAALLDPSFEKRLVEHSVT